MGEDEIGWVEFSSFEGVILYLPMRFMYNPLTNNTHRMHVHWK